MKRSYMIAGGIAAVAALWIGSGIFGGDEPSSDSPKLSDHQDALLQVQVRSLVAEERQRDQVLFGRTEADRSVRLRAETEGKVAEILQLEGAEVAAGDPILRIDMDDRAAQLAEAEANVEHFRIAYEAAKKLAQKSFTSQVRFAESKAQWESAKAHLEAIRQDIDHTTIRAPFDGVVDRISVDVGDFLTTATEAAHLVDLDPIIAVAEVAEAVVGSVAAGAPAILELANGTQVEGVVRYISRVGDATTRTFRVEVMVPNPGRHISEGMTAAMRLSLGTVRTHVVSAAVLTLDDLGRVGVKIVDEQDIVRFMPVNLLADAESGIWLGGLPDKIRVITVGQEFVRDGQKVLPVDEAEVNRPRPDPRSGTLPTADRKLGEAG